MKASTNAKQTILRWRAEGPARFAVEALGVPEKWDGEQGILDWQAEASKAIVEHSRVAVRSGHGVGKSAFEAWTVLWFMSCFFPCKIPVTAPTGHQLRDILWAEIAKWWRRMKQTAPELAQEFGWKTEVFELNSHPKESFAVARTSRPESPEAFQGFHSENLLFLGDEASGIAEEVYQVGEGALSTKGAKVLLCGNPTRTSGYFWDCFHGRKASWYTIRVNGETTPLVSSTYIEEMKSKYGADSNVYRVRVLGEFPTSEDDVVIPLELIEAAHDREVEPIKTIMPVWGLDVARFGNCRTALVKRRANRVEGVKYWHKRDTMEVAGLIMHEYEEAKSDERPAEILVDSIGVGAGVVDRLRELRLPVRGVNVAESPSGKDRYINLRAELWWRARGWFEERNSLLTDKGLAAELSIVKYKITSTGKIQIESKEDMMKRGVDSPDIADAFVLTFAGPDRRKKHDAYDYLPAKSRKSGWTL